MLLSLYKLGFFTSSPLHQHNSTRTFWNCFARALHDNKKNVDGKRRILSIISDQFSYVELENNLKA
jgi:hypothetical protein